MINHNADKLSTDKRIIFFLSRDVSAHFVVHVPVGGKIKRLSSLYKLKNER